MIYIFQGLKNNNDNTFKELSKSFETFRFRELASKGQEAMFHALEEGILMVQDKRITFSNRLF